MKLSRRGFLGLLGGAAAAAIVAPAVEQVAHASAPLFIPAERLDMGVPSGRLATAISWGPEVHGAKTTITAEWVQAAWDRNSGAFLGAQAGLPDGNTITVDTWKYTAVQYEPEPSRPPAWLDNPEFQAGMQRQGYDLTEYREKLGESLGRRLDDEWSWAKEPPSDDFGVRMKTVPPGRIDFDLQPGDDVELINVKDHRGETFKATINRGWEDEIKATGSPIYGLPVAKSEVLGGLYPLQRLPFRWGPIVRPEVHG